MRMTDAEAIGRKRTKSVPNTFRKRFFNLNKRINLKGLMKNRISARSGRMTETIIATTKKIVENKSNVDQPELRIRLLPHVNNLRLISIEKSEAKRQASHDGSPVFSIHLPNMHRVLSTTSPSVSNNQSRYAPY